MLSAYPALTSGDIGTAAVVARLTAVVQKAAGQVRPDAQFLANQYYREGQQPGPLQVLPPKRPTAQSSATTAPPELNWYEGYAIVVDAQGKGTISVHFASSGWNTGLGTVPCVAYSMDQLAGTTSRATPSFTIEQLVQLATSPGMSLEP